jgi:hypothetical protein
MLLVFALINDHVFAVARPMIIDLNLGKIKGFKIVFKTLG